METEPAEQHLRELLAVEYGIVVDQLIRLKSVIGVTASSGRRFIWKPVSGDPAAMALRLQMIHQVAGLLSQHGFTAAFPVPNRRQALLTHTLDGQIGYVQPWLPGRHVQLASLQERLCTVATVGHLHRLSAQWPLHRWASWSGPQLVAKLGAKREACSQVWSTAIAHYPQLAAVESTMLSEVEAGYQAALWLRERTLALSDGGVACSLAFCHRDLAPHNLLWADGRLDVSLIDFDLAGVDHPFVDLMQLANHTLFLTDPKPRLFRELVAVHRRTAGWSPALEPVIWQLLRFPDLFVRTLMEWVNTGCAASRQEKLIVALEKERLRREIWTRDWHDR